MIPPEYMAILKRWFWLIGLFAVVGGAAVYGLAATTKFGEGRTYDASATLGVSRVLSYSGQVASASSTGAEGDATTAAAVGLTNWAKTPQFFAGVREQMRDAGYEVSQAEVYNKVSISSDRAPGLIVISSSGTDKDKTEQLVETSASVLQERAKAEEDEIRTGIDANLARLSDNLRSQLADIYSQLAQKTRSPGDAALRLAMTQFFSRGTPGSSTDEFAAIVRDLASATSDPSMIVLLSQSDAIQQELGQVSSDQSHLTADLQRWEEPLIVVSPAETVESQVVSRLRKRDLVFMGGLAGLVVGWAVANIAEHMRPGAERQSMAPARDKEWETI